MVRMTAKQKSPSRLRRDEYRMSIYNSCKQILELEQKSEELLIMEDQVSLLNATLFQKLDTIDEQKQELNTLKNKNMKKRTSLSFRSIVNVDIPPSKPVCPCLAEVSQPYWHIPNFCGPVEEDDVWCCG